MPGPALTTPPLRGGTAQPTPRCRTMRMDVAALAITLVAGGCTSPVERDLEAVKAARSVLAEWALVEDRAAHGTPGRYLDEMRSASQRQLHTAAAELGAHHPEASALIDAVNTDVPHPEDLKRARDGLEPLEAALEHP